MNCSTTGFPVLPYLLEFGFLLCLYPGFPATSTQDWLACFLRDFLLSASLSIPIRLRAGPRHFLPELQQVLNWHPGLGLSSPFRCQMLVLKHKSDLILSLKAFSGCPPSSGFKFRLSFAGPGWRSLQPCPLLSSARPNHIQLLLALPKD